jgi:hypothetical protein
MKISEHSVAELKKILEQELGLATTHEEAEKIGAWLIGFYGRLAKDNSQNNATGIKSGNIKKHTT